MLNIHRDQKKIAQLFAFAVILAAAARLYLLWQYYCISSDGVVYLRAAKNFYEGDVAGGLASVYPPGYPLLIAAVYPLIGDWELAGQILSLLFGIGILWPLFWIFREAFGERIALVACYLAAINPYLALYSVHVRTESAYLFFSSVALFFFISGVQSQHAGRVLSGGLAAGYAYLIRPEAIGWLVLVPLYLLVRWFTKKDLAIGRVAKFSAALCAAFLVCALPYIIYLSIETGRAGAISRKAGITLAINLKESGYLHANDSTVEESVESFVFTDYIQEHPFRYIQKVVSDLPAATGVFFEALYYSYVPFLLIGLVLISREGFWDRKDLLLLGFVLLYVYGFALFYVKRRYALQAVPFSLGWVALGMCWLWSYLQNKFPGRKSAIIGSCIALAFLLGTLPKTLKAVSREKAYVRDAGWYLKERNQSGELKVAVFDRRVTFYAQAKTIFLDPRDPPSLASHLRGEGADYLAAEVRILDKIYPGVSIRPEDFGLVLERKFVGTRKAQMLVFKVG